MRIKSAPRYPRSRTHNHKNMERQPQQGSVEPVPGFTFDPCKTCTKLPTPCRSLLLNHAPKTHFALHTRLLIALSVTLSTPASHAQSIARIWNEQNLSAIRQDFPNPPVHARNLFHTSVAMWDAWAAYDALAVGYLYQRKHTWADKAAARRESISYAAYRILVQTL